ncbi:MAG TPA: uracil-DNA glycosylase family protein [Gaiellaceae bacterium]|nr:uracil-DNA glycosylase family protein [Gaiellaceae bacterium]
MGSPDDEIYDRYLRKAIREINELGDEIARAAGDRTPVLGSGHPLADVLMVKWSPQRSESQEGVAYFGRAGQAVLKSLQRLRVDPMAVYGTNCAKFEGGDADERAQAWLTQELHIVQPKLVIVMGERALAFVNALEFPLAREVEATRGEIQQFTATIGALVTPDIDESLDEAPAKTAFWNAFRALGPWWAALPPY